MVTAALSCGCCRHGGHGDIDVRISLDGNSHRIISEVPVEGEDEMEANLYYSRVKRLSDGSLLISFMNDF